MKRTFQSEDSRKDKLFAAWSEHLDQVDTMLVNINGGAGSFDSVLEGMAQINKLSETAVDLMFESGEVVSGLSISQDIYSSTCRFDSIYLVLGKMDNKWWPVDLISIMSFVNEKKGEVHFSINPKLVAPMAPAFH